MLIINNQKSLEELCSLIEVSEKIISIDTEFERRTTFFAKLSIVQIATPSMQIIIDFLSGINLAPFKQILSNDRILKIFHSPRGDFEIFYRLFREIPKNTFDTQVAANVCGVGTNLSYGDLCAEICGITIDKTYQKADWMKRPIKPEMLAYAIKDVDYLIPIYNILQKIILDKNLFQEYEQQINELMKIENYTVNLNDAWKKIRLPRASPWFIANLKVIAAFREECATTADIPRRHFATDEDLIKICNHLPTNNEKFNKLKLDSWTLKKDKYKQKLFNLCIGLEENSESSS